MKRLGSKINLQIYHHPYETEIRNCGVQEKFVKPTNHVAQMYRPLDETPLTMVNTGLSLDLMISELKKAAEVAVDLEHHAYRSYLGFTCLMQISTRNQDYIVDTLALREELYKLNLITTDENIVKVFHGGQADILWLQKDLGAGFENESKNFKFSHKIRKYFWKKSKLKVSNIFEYFSNTTFGIYVVNMFDTFHASKKLQLPKHSYDFLLQHYCKVRVDKRYQLADWRVRPIPAEMLRYAREDTHYLLYIFDRLRIDLEQKAIGNVRQVFQRSREVSLQKFEKPIFTEESYLKVYKKKNRKEFNSQQLEAFRKWVAPCVVLISNECCFPMIVSHSNTHESNGTLTSKGWIFMLVLA